MKEKPILFSTPMVKAILKGRKTMTRRPFTFKLLGSKQILSSKNLKNTGYKLGEYCTGHIETGAVLYSFDGNGLWQQVTEPVIPRYKVGNILWVRETWIGHKGNYGYKADDISIGGGWRPSIFMPRDACRLLLRVTGVRAERIQNMPDADGEAEGVENIFQFMNLWNSLNAKRGYCWDSNPYVFAYSFEPLKIQYSWDGHPCVFTESFESAKVG